MVLSLAHRNVSSARPMQIVRTRIRLNVSRIVALSAIRRTMAVVGTEHPSAYPTVWKSAASSVILPTMMAAMGKRPSVLRMHPDVSAVAPMAIAVESNVFKRNVNFVTRLIMPVAAGRHPSVGQTDKPVSVVVVTGTVLTDNVSMRNVSPVILSTTRAVPRRVHSVGTAVLV